MHLVNWTWEYCSIYCIITLDLNTIRVMSLTPDGHTERLGFPRGRPRRCFRGNVFRQPCAGRCPSSGTSFGHSDAAWAAAALPRLTAQLGLPPALPRLTAQLRLPLSEAVFIPGPGALLGLWGFFWGSFLHCVRSNKAAHYPANSPPLAAWV